MSVATSSHSQRTNNRILRHLLLASVVAAPSLATTTVNAQDRDEQFLLVAGRCMLAGESSPKQGKVLLLADEVTYEADTQVVKATGNVELAYYDCVLVADEISYSQSSESVAATGNVALMEPSGHVVTADSVDLENGLENGVITRFGVVLAEKAKMAASSAERQSGRKTLLNNVVYSPCEVCEGDDSPPLWQIKAVRVTHDEENKTISYRHAIFEVGGVPVLYLPYFAHADPSVDRKSGFLVPSLGNSTDLGNFIETPYHWALSPHHDATISPLITSREGTVLKGEYRRRTRHGTYRTQASLLYNESKDELGISKDEKDFRSHLFADGRFALTNIWKWGYDVKLSSDDTYLERYEISQLDRLTSNLYAEAFAGRDYASMNGFYFQGLREEDDPGNTPLVLPLGELTWYSQMRPLGGAVWFNANVLGLRRDEGEDSYRVSFASNWERQAVLANGLVLRGFGEGRADLYYTNDRNPTDDPALPDDSDIIGRVLPTAGVELRWPFARTGGRFYQVIEPTVQLIYSPYGGNGEGIPNEDSASFEFDDTNLFSANKLPGLDLWESGPRANIGFRYGIYGPYGGQIDFVFGQNFRLKEDSVFDSATGLGDQQSDYVGRLVFRPNDLIHVTHRFRIDRENWAFSRNEVSAIVGNENYWSKMSYVRLSEELSDSGLEEREEAAIETRLKIYKNWSFEGAARRDLANANMISSGAGLIYENECVQLKLLFKRRFTRDRDIEPSSSFNMRVRLKTFGDTRSR